MPRLQLEALRLVPSYVFGAGKISSMELQPVAVGCSTHSRWVATPSAAGSAVNAQLANFMRRMVFRGATLLMKFCREGSQGTWLCLGGRAPKR